MSGLCGIVCAGGIWTGGALFGRVVVFRLGVRAASQELSFFDWTEERIGGIILEVHDYYLVVSVWVAEGVEMKE